MLSTLRIGDFTFRISKSVVSLKRQILLRESIFCNFIYIVFIIYIYIRFYESVISLDQCVALRVFTIPCLVFSLDTGVIVSDYCECYIITIINTICRILNYNSIVFITFSNA